MGGTGRKLTTSAGMILALVGATLLAVAIALIFNRSRAPDRPKAVQPRAAPAASAPTDTARDSPTAPAAPDRSAVVEGGAGEVLVRIVDAATGAPVADQDFEVVRERAGTLPEGFVRPAGATDGPKLFAKGRTNARGEALVTGVHESLALVQCARRLPHAAGVTAVVGPATRRRTAELRLDAGGMVLGRVVDDRGEPVLDALIDLGWNLPWNAAGSPQRFDEEVARSGLDGRFAIECVRALPLQVFSDLETVWAMRWSPVIVRARVGSRKQGTSATVRPCESVSLLDIVLPRASTWRGVVLDARGDPVEGALVSANPLRSRITQVNLHRFDPKAVDDGVLTAPGGPEFRLLDTEALTDALGHFELEARSPRGGALVWTQWDQMQEFPLPELAPGAEKNEIALRLSAGWVLSARLFDIEGAPILAVPPGSIGDPGAPRTMPLDQARQETWSTARAVLKAELEDGRELRVLAAPDAGGTFAFQLACRPSEVQAFEISSPGFRPARRAVNGSLRANATLEERLEPLARLRLALTVEGAPEHWEGEPQQIVVRACQLAPDLQTTAGGAPRPTCCGVGVHMDVRATGGALDADIPVPSEAPYWLYVRTVRSGESDERTAGPFAAGEHRHAVRVSYIEGRSVEAATTNARAVPTPPANDASTLGALHFSVVDARTLAAIGAARITAICDPDGKSQLSAREWFSDDSGVARLDGLSAGRWSLRIAAPGYASTATTAIEVAAGGVTEVDRVALEPERVH